MHLHLYITALTNSYHTTRPKKTKSTQKFVQKEYKMLKKRKKSKLPLNWLFPAGQSSQQTGLFQKYPSGSPLVNTVGCELHADVETITGFNCDQLDLSPNLTESPRRSIGACDRFFIPNADVASSSIVEEARRTSAGSRERNAQIVGSPVEVDSSDPIEDFRLSMEEMLGAYHVERGRPLDWERLEDLLCAYLEVNEREVYRYIFAAFFDLTVELGHLW